MRWKREKRALYTLEKYLQYVPCSHVQFNWAILCPLNAIVEKRFMTSKIDYDAKILRAFVPIELDM